MAKLVCTNAWFAIRANAAKTILNVGHFLHLYQNDIDPDPTYSHFNDFVECDCDGYAPIDLGGKFGAINKIIDGEYLCESNLFTYHSPTFQPNIIYGWYISNTANVVMCQRFNQPIHFNVGSENIVLKIEFLDIALSILNF